MNCKSCNGEVPSSMGHAVALNQCPYCGESIFDKAVGALILALGKQSFVKDDDLFHNTAEGLNKQIMDTVLSIVVDKFDISWKKTLVEEPTERSQLASKTKSSTSIQRSDSSAEKRTIDGIGNIDDIADLNEDDLKLLNSGVSEDQKITMVDVAKAKAARDQVVDNSSQDQSVEVKKQPYEKRPVSRRDD